MAGLFRRVVGKLFSSRQAPVRATTQAAHVRERTYGGSTKDMARAYGVTERTVQRWIKGDRVPATATEKDRAKAHKNKKPVPVKPGDRLAAEAAAAQVTDRGRERRAKQYEQQGTGVTVRFNGVTTKVKHSDMANRNRPMVLSLDGDQAGRLARAKDDAEVQEVIGGALADYFNSGSSSGYIASDFDFDPNGVDLL